MSRFVLMNKEGRYKAYANSEFVIENPISNYSEITRTGEQPELLIFFCHISTRIYRDIIWCFVGGGENVGIYYDWSSDPTVNYEVLYQSKYRDFLNVLEGLGYDRSSIVLNEAIVQLQEMVTNANAE